LAARLDPPAWRRSGEAPDSYAWDAKHSHCSASSYPLAPRFVSRLEAFVDLITRPTWANVLLLLAGVVLAPSWRTVTAALRILGRDRDRSFCTFHRILNRAAWSSRATARRLLLLLVDTFVPSGVTIVIGLDDTIERPGEPRSVPAVFTAIRCVPQRGIVKASGLRWLSAMLLVKIRCADPLWRCPFSPSLPRLNESMPTSPEPQRHFSIGPSKPPANPPLASPSVRRAGRRQRICGHQISSCRPRPCP
jgi:hypothetical protein